MQPGQFGKLGSKLALAIIFVGFVGILVGWNGTAGNLVLAAQIPYIVSGGLGGVALVIVGAALMVTQNARQDRQRLEGVLMQLVEAQQGTGSGVVPSDVDGLFAAGTASYHVPGCRLVDGREEVTYVTAAEAAARDLKPCRVCQPEHATNVTVH
ncbi:MAG: hypothetical protein QOJ79_3571 [Actinomycetota bacterium]|jgi:hypothetical protein|nr:hypothetical protein [Actinomycetota bacterium]